MMADSHLTRELLRAVIQGKIPPRVLTEVGMSHLMSLCGHCREEIEAFRKERTGDTSADYSRTFEVLPAVLGDGLRRLEQERVQVARDLRELLALPREDREGRIRRARGRFRSPLLVRSLLDESRRRLPGEAAEALHLADLARMVVQRNPSMPGAFDLLALATAEKANACRVLDDVTQAEEAFGHVHLLATEHNVTDPAILARIAELESSLRKDQRRFSEAEDLLAQALVHYQISGNDQGIARVLLKLADTHFLAGNFDGAIEQVRSALERIDPETARRLYLCGRHNLAFYLTEIGSHDEAAAVLAEDEDRYREFADAWTQLRLVWIQARIAAGIGDPADAEKAFIAARDGFVAEKNGYDAAMITMELVLLYLRQDRTADVKRAAEEMYPIFQAQDVHREALAALVLFQDAARREELTVRKVREIAAYLREARGRPELRFRRGEGTS
jgi:tetratricopeptide (TPR) repeat protein